MRPPARIPPHNLDAERAVLGAALLDPAATALVIDLPSAAFYTGAHRLISEAVTRLGRRGTPVDLLTLEAELRATGSLDQAGGLAALGLLAECGAIAAHVPAYLSLVRDCAARRELIQLGTEIVRGASEDNGPAPNSQVTSAIGRLLKIDAGTSSLCGAAELFEDHPECDAVAIPSGLDVFDDATDGFTPGHLTVIAGRPGMGKTQCSLQSAHRIATLDKRRVLFISLEMPPSEIGMRMLSIETGYPNRLIRTRTAPDMERVAKARAALREIPFQVQRAAVRQLTDVLGLIRTAVARDRAELVFIDHLGRIQGTRRESRYLEVGQVAEELKTVALQLNVPVVALCQLNREIEGRNRNSLKPQLSDLRDSGRIEEEADEILFLWTEEERPEGKDPLPVNITLAKARNDATGSRPYLFQKSRGRFVPASRRQE